MKISYNLLKEFIPLKIAAEKLADALNEHAFEVEEIIDLKPRFSNVFTAKVIEYQKHPNADRLRIVKLEIGGRTIDPVVCGASNFEAGDMVALALPGAQIPQDIHSAGHEPFTLQKAKIRGVESQGMICAAFELGLEPEPGEGIMILDKSLETGLDLRDLVGQNDAVLDISLPANRPDLYSHMGVAREIAAVLNLKFKEPKFKGRLSVSSRGGLKVRVLDKAACAKYYGLKFSDIKVRPSPQFIQDFLKAAGMRPVNNIVDITNFVMMEIGQPLHAFDASKVSGGIIVRRAKPGEKLLGLNHKEYVLDPSMLVVADERKALALAGIMGGAESEVTQETGSIILEAANFNPVLTRMAAKKLGLRTDSSNIFEKGPHPNLASIGMSRAAELIMRFADAKASELAEFEAKAKAKPKIKFTAEGVGKLLGAKLSPAQIKKLLARYGIKTTGTKTMQAIVPWWRNDLETMPDVAEEALKLYGYNAVKRLPLAVNAGRVETGGNDEAAFIDDTKNFWARLGLAEAQNYSFVSEEDIIKFKDDPKRYLEISNPLSADQKYLKRHLLIPLLKNIALNQRHFGEFGLFEIGKQYLGFENEPVLLSAVLFSKSDAFEKLIAKAKAYAAAYLKRLGINEGGTAFAETGKPWLSIKCQDAEIGLVGAVQKELLDNFDIKGRVSFVKLELDKLRRLGKDVALVPVNKFPSVSRDISLVVDKGIKWGQIERIIRPVSDLITGISLFEADFLAADKSAQEFHKNLARKGKKNLGARLTFQGLNKTLKDSEIASIMGQIVLKLQRELKAEIR